MSPACEYEIAGQIKHNGRQNIVTDCFSLNRFRLVEICAWHVCAIILNLLCQLFTSIVLSRCNAYDVRLLLGATHAVDVYFVSHRNVVRKYMLCTCVVQVLAVMRPADEDVCKLVHDFGVRVCFMHRIGAFEAKISRAFMARGMLAARSMFVYFVGVEQITQK